jgi:flavin-binding protein dodecin
MTKDTYRDLLLTELDRSEALRARSREDPEFNGKRVLLRVWQAGRLARTHRDLLESRRFHDAAQFFLNDLYGPTDLSRHIEEVRRIVPVMTNVLPDSGLATVAHAMELNAISESLDEAMVETLGDKAETLDEATYAAAYRAIDRAEDRARQIDLIELLGMALDKLTHIHFIGMTLKLMRKPARLAGLGELQAFLERGYSAFGAMRGGSSEFVTIVVGRERAISRALLNGDDEALRRPQPRP